MSFKASPANAKHCIGLFRMFSVYIADGSVLNSDVVDVKPCSSIFTRHIQIACSSHAAQVGSFEHGNNNIRLEVNMCQHFSSAGMASTVAILVLRYV